MNLIGNVLLFVKNGFFYIKGIKQIIIYNFKPKKFDIQYFYENKWNIQNVHIDRLNEHLPHLIPIQLNCCKQTELMYKFYIQYSINII